MYINTYHVSTLEYLDPVLTFSHREIPVSEALSLVDARSIRNINSAPIEYVNTNMNPSILYKKTTIPNDANFVDEKNSNYQQVVNSVIRHKLRLNGIDLILAETVCYYDFLGEKSSQPIFDIYKTNLEKIQEGPLVSPCNSQPLPEYIICSNGHVLKIRKSMKVLRTPAYETGSKKFKYTQVLLYFPLKPGEEILINNIGIIIPNNFQY